MTSSISHFVKTVCMKDWWLTKADDDSSGNTLAVAGIESCGRQAARVFFSAPIVERLDLFTLKTADGIFVLLKGPINKEQTCQNGFTEEVFKYFHIGFPSNWEKCAEKCGRQGEGSEANADADILPEPNTVTKKGNAALTQKLWRDSDNNNRPEHVTDEAQEAVTDDLLDDQNIDSVEGLSFEDARSSAQNLIKDMHTCVNTDSNDSNVGYVGERVRYCLRNRKIPYFGSKGVYRGKHVKHVAKGKSSSKETSIGADTSTLPSVAPLEKSQSCGMTPLCDTSSTEKADHPNVAAIGGVNGSNHAKSIATRRSMSISGEASVVDKGMHRIKEAQKSQRHDNTTPIPEDTGKTKNLSSNNPGVGKSCLQQKRKRSESRTVRNRIVTRSSLKKSGENLHASSMSSAVGLKNSAKSVGVAVGGRNIEKRSTREATRPLETNVNFSLQDADKLESSTSHHICVENPHGAKDRMQRNISSRTTADNMNCHDSARSTFRTCTSKARSNSKAAGVERERIASQGCLLKLGTSRKLDYAQEAVHTPERENKSPTSRGSVLRTSRSGRLLLPTMEFWRNQLPIYDVDHGLSGVMEGSTILKVKTLEVGNQKNKRVVAGRNKVGRAP